MRGPGESYSDVILRLVEIETLAYHIPLPFPDWHDIVDAGGACLRRELGVSQPLWGEACRILAGSAPR